jgi:hypothetical protein
MPPLVFLLVIGVGSVVTVVGLVVLLAALTTPPRAQPRLRLWGRAWRLRPAAVLALLAGGLCLGGALVYGPGGLPYAPSAPADRRGSHGHDPQVSQDHAQDRPGDDWAAVLPGGAGEMVPPGRHQPQPFQALAPASPVNLTGEWTIMNTVVETSYPLYRDLRLEFRVMVHQDGVAFTGTGEKSLENGRPIPVTARSPIRLQGRVVDGSVIEATFQEDGRSRRTQGQFRLTLQDRHHLTGTFASTAAAARGASQWRRAAAQQGGPAPGREAARQDGPEGPPPDQGAPPPRAPGPAGRDTAREHRPRLQLGLSPTEVRDLLGEPVRVEDAPTFVFWHYGADAYVVFERGTGRVYGWVGVSS